MLYGHTITIWEFGDGSHLAVSIETRKENGEQYSALTGFFRQFEFYYVVVVVVVADEHNLIALCANHRDERVEFYRVTASKAGARALLDDDVLQMNALAEKPCWYNALTLNCTRTVWHHAKAVGSIFPTDCRLLANGYLVDLYYEYGSVSTGIGLEEMVRRSDITEQARTAGIDLDFFSAIREGLPPRFLNAPADGDAIELRTPASSAISRFLKKNVLNGTET